MDELSTAWAHSKNDEGKRHALVDHLTATAELCKQFCEPFGAGELGYWLGLWHDTGKFNLEWQRYLIAAEAEPGKKHRGPEHKIAGTTLAELYAGLAALAIHGHHGGLTTRAAVSSKAAEPAVAAAAGKALALARRAMPKLDPDGPIPLPETASATAGEMFIRMVFSALVDADSLDTEAHKNRSASELRGGEITIDELWHSLQVDQAQLMDDAADTPVNQLRREVYDACVATADRPPGLFKLTVPTGGGKTRAGMAFALRHAQANGLRRVVVAVPFITITDQTASTYRDIFGESDDRVTVLEHHSGIQPPEDDDDFSPAAVRARLATENWDAPIVVTTTVRLFESMFSNRRSDCRRLHRLAKSVIILDEAQALPVRLLDPILDALREFCTAYGSTVVLSTATQPAFTALKPFADLPATEIAPDPPRLFAALKRVGYDWRLGEKLTWPQVAEIMGGHRQVLTVLNTRKDAIACLDALGDPGALHLSTSLCGAHRRDVIDKVKGRLAGGEPCRLVSTQVIEAGVDIDFPVVMRAFGPFDAIIQAAGRANREGSPKQGLVIVFIPADGGLPRGDYPARTSATATLLAADRLDPHDPATIEAYFRRIYTDIGTDRDQIQNKRAALNYPDVATAFRMIDEETDPVVVTSYGCEEKRREVRHWLDALQNATDNPRTLLRKLQPYTVGMRRGEADRCRKGGLIAEVALGVGEWCGKYDPIKGLVTAHDEDVF